MRFFINLTILSCIQLFNCFSAHSNEILSEHVVYYAGDVNTAVIEHSGQWVGIYGTPQSFDEEMDSVLFTHHRRDVVWAGMAAIANGADAVVPEGDALYFSDAVEYWSEQQPSTQNGVQANIPLNNFHRFWGGFAQRRFHDYAQQTTKILTRPISIKRTVNDGDVIDLDGLENRVLDTPGYTRGSVTYVVDDLGTRIAFTGDLIYGDGQIFDIYSLQDEIPEANLRGYHGYAARIADVISSLDKVLAAEPDVLVPARGPLIRNPKTSIPLLQKRLREVYRNYLSTSALLWYFGEEHIQTCADRVLGEGNKIEPVVWAESVLDEAPGWIRDVNTSRLLISENKEALLIDCGYQSVIDYVKQLIKDGEITTLSAIYATHYHNDHTDMIAVAAEEFGCPVYSHTVMEDILEYPGAYRMPAATDKAVENTIVFAEGESLRWNEFTLTFYDYPGQALYHSGMHVKKDDAESILFVGDSFTPSGIDDYCLLNRNLMHQDTGYFRCLDVLTRIDPDTYLINQHVKQPFRFSAQQIQALRNAYHERFDLLVELIPFDDPNYGIDEGWARFYPYGQEVTTGDNAHLFLRIYNHSPVEQLFTVTINPPDGWSCAQREISVLIPALTQQKVQYTLQPVSPSASGVHVVTADVAFGDWVLHEWAESLLFPVSNREDLTSN